MQKTISQNVIDLLVIGGGPAGMMCAIAAAKRFREQSAAANVKSKIVLLEKNDTPGKKLLVAGSGRCNLTHSGAIADFLDHYGDHGRFVRPALYHFTNGDLARFFSDHGLPLVELNDGKLFPRTQSSRDVLRVLLDEMRNSGIELRNNATVESMALHNDGTFAVQTPVQNTNDKTATFFAKRVVIATGGKTYPTTGSTGDGYRLAQSLGHTIIEPTPALAPVRVRDYRFAECAGLSFENANVRVLRNGKKIATSTGDLLLTHHGLSGPVILDMSRNITPGDVVCVSFVRSFSDVDVFEKQLLEDATNFGRKSVKNMLAQYDVPERLLLMLFELNGISLDLAVAEMPRETRRTLARSLIAHPFVIARLGGENEAMVTCGGVSLPEVDRKTMQSRLVPNLYFCGETLDIDGDTGGYNLQFAFSSGKLAADSMA